MLKSNFYYNFALKSYFQVCKAIDALYAVIKQKQNVKKLLGETEKINLQFCFKKIPDTKNITIKM